MYCYIQEIQMKDSNSLGCGKELCVTETKWITNGVSNIIYGYTYSDEKFERPIKTAYKISIHDKSYRDDKGKVRKKQYHVATIKYYDLVDYGWYDCIIHSKIDDIAEAMGMNSEIVWNEVTEKLDALFDRVNAKFEQTEEYKVKQKNNAIIKEYQVKKHQFAEKYEVRENEYDMCYDVFGKLRNKDYLDKIKREYKARKEYEERSRSYQRDYYSNYNSYSSSSRTSSFQGGVVSEKEKEYYKKFYRTLATKFHPDVSGDNEAMQLINKLKEQWEI